MKIQHHESDEDIDDDEDGDAAMVKGSLHSTGGIGAKFETETKRKAAYGGQESLQNALDQHGSEELQNTPRKGPAQHGGCARGQSTDQRTGQPIDVKKVDKAPGSKT